MKNYVIKTHIKFICYSISMINAWNSKIADMPLSSSIISFLLYLSTNPCMNIS